MLNESKMLPDDIIARRKSVDGDHARIACRDQSTSHLKDEDGARVALDTGDIVMVAAWLNSADDHLKLQVRIVLIQARFKVRRSSVIGKIDCAPFNVEYAVRRAPRY